jgi:ubiquinol-cytochrome c reductase cytochrome c subunit
VLFLSSRRRHPLAGLVVVLCGLVVAGVLFSAFSPASATGSTKADEQLIEQGRNLFTVGCSSCHGLNAEGVVSKGDHNYGPPLVGVGPAAVYFQMSTGRMPLQQPGVQAQPKENIYTDEEIAAIAAYIGSLAPGPSLPDAELYDPSLGDVVRGRDFFQTNCTACHNFAGSGGALPQGGYAPSLMNTSSLDMYLAMLTGPGQMPVFSDGVMTPEDKRDIIAYIDSLKTQTDYGGSSIGSLGAVSEGLWGWLTGIGALVLVAVWIGNNGVRARKKHQ